MSFKGIQLRGTQGNLGELEGVSGVTIQTENNHYT